MPPGNKYKTIFWAYVFKNGTSEVALNYSKELRQVPTSKVQERAAGAMIHSSVVQVQELKPGMSNLRRYSSLCSQIQTFHIFIYRGHKPLISIGPEHLTALLVFWKKREFFFHYKCIPEKKRSVSFLSLRLRLICSQQILCSISFA